MLSQQPLVTRILGSNCCGDTTSQDLLTQGGAVRQKDARRRRINIRFRRRQINYHTPLVPKANRLPPGLSSQLLAAPGGWCWCCTETSLLSSLLDFIPCLLCSLLTLLPREKMRVRATACVTSAQLMECAVVGSVPLVVPRGRDGLAERS